MTLKNCIVLLSVTLALAVCGQAPLKAIEPLPDDIEQYAEIPAPVEEEPPPQVNDEFHHIVGGWALRQTGPTSWTWLEGGSILAVQDHGSVRYIDIYNRLVREVTIPEQMLLGDYRMELYDNRIFVAGGNSTFGGPGGPLSAVKIDGEWVLVNGSVWDGEGNLIRELSQLDGREVELYHSGMLLMTDECHSTNYTRLWYATSDDWTLRELVYWERRHSSQGARNGYFAFISSWTHEFRVIDTATASIVSSYTSEAETTQFRLLGIREVEGSLQYIYAAWMDGQDHFFIYDEGTGATWGIDSKIYGRNDINAPLTHFVERYPSGRNVLEQDVSGIRVREIK